MKYVDATAAVIDGIEQQISAGDSVEEAAQATATLLYETFEDTTVLARVFVTVPYARLPAPDQDFLRRLAAARGERALKPATPVLSLLGTRGIHPRWNDRHHSAGHRGIPLASMEFVESIPMVARLLKELGATLEWAQHLDTAVVTASLGPAAGLFYVEDAAQAVDQDGRRIITADDFVRDYGVRTVFGFGGAYPVLGTFVAAVVFSSETVPMREVDRFMRLANTFKAVTMRLVRDGRIFVPSLSPAGRHAR